LVTIKTAPENTRPVTRIDLLREISQQQVEVAMQAQQVHQTPQGGDKMEESAPKPVKEILSEKITVAIFCALAEESVAVRLSLDEKMECHLTTIGPRNYIYSFGRIGDHNIVVARPTKMGPVSAALCAATVNQQFPNVRFALMVGIGAGIPNLPKRDIRLGDVAVSIPRENHPGVLQYDFGKYEQDGKFDLKGTLNKPPPILTSADGSLEEDEIMDESPLWGILGNITKHRRYARPNCDDVLYDPTFHHVNNGDDCTGCELSNKKIVVSRPEREGSCGQPAVHRGLILSGGGVVKNPEDRDRLRRGQKDAICFEMEAAGIADEIPCLVVRGICDYADTHKRDNWHHYAAAVAAAYTKAILLKFNGPELEDTRTMRETMQERECEQHDRLPTYY
jgi:nucleoside phosphorylase